MKDSKAPNSAGDLVPDFHKSNSTQTELMKAQSEMLICISGQIMSAEEYLDEWAEPEKPQRSCERQPHQDLRRRSIIEK